jgi:hypothetical protein
LQLPKRRQRHIPVVPQGERDKRNAIAWHRSQQCCDLGGSFGQDRRSAHRAGMDGAASLQPLNQEPAELCAQDSVTVDRLHCSLDELDVRGNANTPALRHALA